MYSIELSETAKKALQKIEKCDSEIILKKLFSLRDNPFHHLKRLHGCKFWRLRIMKYRAVVDVIVSVRKIIVVRVGIRENVYDKL